MEVLKELPERLSETMKVSRRGFLKGLGALSATAAIYGCGGGENLAQYKTEPSVTPQDNLVVDKETKSVLHGHVAHCAGACLLKLHVKNGRVVKITSPGDISRADAAAAAGKLISGANPFGIVPGVWASSDAADESLGPIQRRCCLKGFAETKRLYSPDRLKYPLKQTGQRGDYRGFKKISWDEAIDTVAKMYTEMQARKSALGYVPILDSGTSLAQYLGPYIGTYGNSSAGNMCDAKFAAIGPDSAYQGNPLVTGNSVADILNSKFILAWACDHRVTRNQNPFYMTKAKEAGIPIVYVDARHTDSVSVMSTGSGDVPPWISVRPGTDDAMAAAMANVIYRKNLHDDAFIKQYCFGFYPGDSVVSKSVLKDPVTGAAYAGQTFKVPSGQSFVEYLDELEAKNGGYNGVLQWASRLTGAPAAVIENLAIKYATSKPAYLLTGIHAPGSTFGGAQRTNTGMYYVWLLIALSSMTGNINKRGGGCGDQRIGDGYAIQLGAAPAAKVPATSYGAIAVSAWHRGEVILTGRDHRTAEQLRADVLLLNKIDLGANPRITVEMVYRGSGDSAHLQQRPGLNKALLAYKKLKYIVAHEINMAPDAAIADIVLPVTHNFEQNSFVVRAEELFVSSGPVEPLYEAKPDWLIHQLIGQRMGLSLDRGNFSDIDIMKTQWTGAKIPDAYKAIVPDATLPSFDEVMAKANLQLTVPLAQTVIGLSNAPGTNFTDTGRINFYSPFLASRGRTPQGANRAQYVRPVEGYEDILDNGGKVGAKGIKYTLQFITPHILQRAHSQYSNLAILADKLPQVVWIHPVDAAARGINNGDLVYAFNDNGCIKIPAELTKRVRPMMVAIGEGAWYRASTSETYEAWFDTDGDGIAEKTIVPVDVGGATNSITKGLVSGPADPLITSGYGLAAGGNLCEISKTHPDKK